MEPEIALNRALSRSTEEDRFENYGINFQHELRKNFLHIARNHSDRIKIINGNQSPEDVAAQINDSIKTLAL